MEKYNILSSVEKLIDIYPELKQILSKYLVDQKFTHDTKTFLLNDLAVLLLSDIHTIEIATLCSPVLLELLTRASDMSKDDSVTKHEWLCICLSKLIWHFPDVDRFAKQYFEKSYGFFCRFEDDGEPPSKKIRNEMNIVPLYKLVKAANLLLIYDNHTFKELCDWSLLATFLDDSDVKTRWFSYQCLARIGNIKFSDLNSILKANFSENEFTNCITEEFSSTLLWNFGQFRPFKFDVKEQKNFLKFTKDDFSKEVINVEGVLLSRNTDCKKIVKEEKIVYVPSVQKSLYRLALAVSAGEPVLLQGPVGCGKTSLLEHLAVLTGRRPFEELLKVQLGDHMDSKMLLGTHCCTEVPGEFVWKSGILVQAMTEGHWLLLEDIDCAPMDVISLLVPVLQSRTIVLPGHSNPIKAAAGFQLFATQRLLRGFEGSYVEFKNETHIIEKQFRKILMDPLNKEELKKVICTKWPRLDRVCDRILEVYALFSQDIDYASNKSESSEEPLDLYGAHDRLVSTRDLFKFCSRMAQFDPKKLNSLPVFENALECFSDSIPSFEKRVTAAKKIGVKFNIVTSKAAYYCLKDNLKISVRENDITVGRVTLPRNNSFIKMESDYKNVFAHTKQALNLLEKVAAAVSKKEPVLLVGETGTGKTSIVQYLAELTKHKLTVINMSQQSDSVDLIGGYKPVDLVLAVRPVKDMFFHLFPRYANLNNNQRFLAHITNCVYRKKYEEVTELMLYCQSRVMKNLQETNNKSSSNLQQISDWKTLGEKIVTLQQQIRHSRNTLIFKFIEGALVKSMKNGDWILLDEINLAEAETLECLSGILEKHDNTMFLLEKGDKEPVTRHPDFRIFACMNPATDVGKKDLPVGIRNRFTEFFVEEIESKSDLCILVEKYLKGLSLAHSVITEIVDFYLYIRKVSTEKLSDGTGHYPHYSLRTLCRALKYASTNPCHNVPRSLYEAFCLSFLSQLDSASHPFVTTAIANRILGKNQASVLKQNIPEPSNGNYKMINGYWVRCGNQEPSANDTYVFTTTVHRNLHDLARIVSAGRYPVLLQGETSVGKTSLIQWLAKATGNVCVRVNNHEHTDIQEYVGTYSADEFGKLVFKEGILAEAMRKGYWIILDELNLAPTEVMEALNRVLDDNRELFIPETQVVIKAHPGFMIFATQNPPGLYGGRKVLSRAFRNRFIELHFNEIPPIELEDILHKRCRLPSSYSKKLVAIMHELQIRRRESGVFAGKQGFITLRDLFRWGDRYQKVETPPEGIDWRQHLAYEGYLLLAGRVRHPEEMKVIQEVIQYHLKKKIDPNLLFTLSDKTPPASKDILTKSMQSNLSETFKNVVWTYGMRRLAVLVGKAMQYQEPVLLIGTTGSGKTTICQIFAELFGKPLHSVNCHMHSESADFLGGLRPVRDAELRESKLFEWVDGPLIQAMQEGSFFLADEISLADDSVLERLNSVLEPEQKILLAEKSFDDGQLEITACEGFQLFATMNPGGDYGKKELSPALRNRFTEIWCPGSMDILSDVIAIVEHNINQRLKFRKYATSDQSGFGLAIAEFLKHFNGSEIGKRLTLSVRDILTWVEFINFTQTFAFKSKMSSAEAYLHGACLAFLDGIGSGSSATGIDEYSMKVKKDIFSFLMQQIGESRIHFIELMVPEILGSKFEDFAFDAYTTDMSCFGIGPFIIDCGSNVQEDWSSDYILEAKTPKANALRVLRAMQLSKPILLEGSPGVGKTSLISTIAKASGHKLVRINLSEQTDISDLFGADLPVDGGEKGEFAWRDGPLLLALKQGDWILLDELNLASQSVLEGLNACLDHRNEIFIPELGMTFHLNKNIARIFCCQNPHMQGGSRKGLPRSFLNRFTQVYMRPMEKSDMKFIATAVYSTIPHELISAMIEFNSELNTWINVKKKWCRYDTPWEFNLRDVFRWCDVMINNQSESDYNIGEYMKLIYLDRMWAAKDKEKAVHLFKSVIRRCGLDDEQLIMNRNLYLNVFEDCVQLGYSFLPSKGGNRGDSKMVCIPPAQLPCLESLMKCIEMSWMPILVGPSGSGKSTLVRSLAELCGQELHILSVNSEMDTIELLGGFEQADINRKIEFIAQDLQPILEKTILKCLQPQSKINNSNRVLKELLCNLINVRQCIYSGSSLQEDNCLKKLNCLKYLIKAIECLKIKSFSSGIKSCKRALEELIKKSNSKESFNGGQFEWVDSVLINAAKRGHWLLIDDANFCSSSVLDRLNGLLEPGGVLTVNEQGIVGGKLRTIEPHPDFRIILTMNPRNGMISRAMRNRGIEIYVEPISMNLVMNQELYTSSLLAQCKGLVHNQLLLHSCALFQSLVLELKIDAPTMSDFISSASLCVQMGLKHGKPIQAFHESSLAVYAENLLNVNTRNMAVKTIDKEVGRMIAVKSDASIPITDILPSSIDYRQNLICASIKKQAALYTMVYHDFVGKYTEIHPFPGDVDGCPIFVMPPPEGFGTVNLHNDIKRFTVAVRLVFESCPLQSFVYLDTWIRFHLREPPKSVNDPDKQLQIAFTILVQFQDKLMKMATENLMASLTDSVDQIFNLIGYSDVLVRESPMDLRWNKYLYQKIIMLLRQKRDDADRIEYQYISCANRYNLNLLFQSLGFMNEVCMKNCSSNSRSLALIADEVLKNQDLYQDSPLIALISIPQFLKALCASIFEYLEDQAIPCSDDAYWKLYEIINSYHVFQRIFVKPFELADEPQLRQQCDKQMRLLCLHFYWLLKKVRNLYDRDDSMPPTLVKSAEFAENHLSCNNPEQRFRHRCTKWLGQPPVFPDQRSADLYQLVIQLYEALDLPERLKSNKIGLNDVKAIRTNLDPWLNSLCDISYRSIYEKEHKIGKEATEELSDVKNQMYEVEVLISTDNECMEIAVNPGRRPTMSDSELTLELQLLPLWDYLFVTYEAELLCRACTLSEQDFQTADLNFDKSLINMFIKWGTQILGLNPVHLAHLVALQQFQNKQSLAPSIFYFLQHSRHGFSSDALSTLDFEVNNKKIVNVLNKNKEWNCNYSWAKQQPLLTHIFSSIHEEPGNSPLVCHFTLGSYSEKIDQLKKSQTLLWKHFEKLANREKTYRHYSASIIISWFNTLLSAIVALGDVPTMGNDKAGILKLFEKLKVGSLVMTKGKDNILLLAIDSVVELQVLMVQDTNESDLHWTLGKTATFVGLLTSMLLLPRDHLDPALKAKAKTTSLKESIALLTNEKNMREWMSETTVGQSLSREWIPDHPHVKGLIDLCSEYEMKLAITERKVPYRGSDENFNKLKLDAKYYIDTIGSPAEILDIVSKLCLIHESKAREDLNSFSVLQKAQNYSQNLQNFVEKMKKYVLFPELLFPFLVGVEQIIFGLTLCSHSYQMKEAVVSGHSQKLNNIHEFLKQFSEFSTLKWQSSLHMPSTLLNNSSLVNFKLILSFCKDSLPKRGRILYKLVKSAILEIINEIQIGSYRPRSKLNEMKKLLFSAFQSLYEAWRIQDEKIKRKKVEEETMFKTKTHPAELTDEEKMEMELKEMFPSYAEDFEDSSKYNGDQSKQNMSDSVEDDEDDSIQFSAEDMYDVCQLHATVISLFCDKSSVDHKNLFIKQNKEPDFLTPFLLQHEVISSIVTSLGNRLDSFFDKSLLEGQLLRGQELQKFKEQVEDDYYNIYHDPYPEKVVAISPILQKLVQHIYELLKEFPENPNLIQILTVTHRVLNFPVSDPLMKFVVGIECILETTQVWEQNAHSKVSLKSEMNEITGLVIEFRSKELDLWKKGLQCVIKMQYLNSSKWWFFMFPLFYSDNTYDETEKLVIVKGLQQCLEDSPIGEFPARLSILNIFLKEFQLYSTSKTNRGYADILFNIYTYYGQFLPAIESEINNIRKPIEKEIREFVKIARWNDVNFFSVKASVEKSHKFVWKHVKAFEDALKTPAKAAFVLPSRIDSDDIDSSWFLDIKPQDYIYEQTVVKTKCFKEREETFFQKFPTYEKKIKSTSKKIAESFPVAGYINTLNEFCGNIIEALQSASAEGRKSVLTRSREKKQTLQKIQNKKQMLATLFKNLKAIGLSYRQGIIMHREVSAFMSTPAFDISQMKVLKSDNAFEDLLSKSSRDTNHYFYKSLAQYSQLQKCMETPSKDLTLDVIHRIRGYGGHLLNLVTEQRNDIAKMSQDIDKFGSFLTLLTKLYEKEEFTDRKTLTIIPPQAHFHESDGELSNLMMTLILAAGHLDALIECAPESNLIAEEHHSLSFDQVGLSSVLKEDSFWSIMKGAIKSFDCDIRTLLNQFSNLKFSQTLVSWDEIKTFNGICQSVQKSFEKFIGSISEKCDSECSMVQNLFNLYERVNQQCKVYEKEEAKLFESQKVEKSIQNNQQAVIISKMCQKVAKKVLLAIQEMVQFSSDVNEDKSNTNVVPEGLFTAKISSSLLEVKKCLHFDEVLRLMRRLNVHVSQFQKSFEKLSPCDKSFRLLVNLAPLLNQYYQLLKVYLAITMGMHRTSCKFLSILLEIFNILAIKGFCIPPELQEEAAKSDATKFEDIESGGLGEGEGSKDVSEKIETEDQLEDALQKGEEKKDQDESKDKDLKDEEQGIEMSNDFEGKAHSAEDGEEEDGDDEEDADSDLDKQMGDVEEDDDAEKLDDKIWGSDSENEDELKEEDGSGGVTDNGVSELVAKDNKFKEDDEKGDKGELPQDVPLDAENEEYKAEKPDPLIDAPPEEEPEVAELPENMEITDVDKDGADDETMEMTEPEDKLDESKGDEPDVSENPEEVEKEGEANKAEETADGEDDMKGKDAVDPDVKEGMEDSDVQKQDDDALPTQTPTAEIQALPSEMEKSSNDPVQSTEAMDWEMGAQSSEEQHKEGLAESSNMPSDEPGHEGKKTSSGARELAEKSFNPKLRPPGENRTLDENAEEQNAQTRSIQDRRSTIPYESNQDDGDTAEMYEHVLREEEGTTQAIDIATNEQADRRAVQNQTQDDDDDDDVILLSSGDEGDEADSRPVGDSLKTNPSQKSGERGEMGEIEEDMDITEGEIVHTQVASRGTESTIHTQNELWKALSSGAGQRSKARSTSHANMPPLTSASCTTDMWRYYEMQVQNLSHELCEQLRLVLEPTKMSKFKGDFRTGKRLNMRKIIPYIASQFRKDKIWLRRTKPTKRQYQIMLAVDDSSSMSDNNSKQLAFESLAVLGQSLNLLEAGELSVVSFGENIQLLHGFQDQFSDIAGARILEHFTFSQAKTKIAELLNYATDFMIQARNTASSRLTSKETAQLLVIISDGRGINAEGENIVKTAVKNARDNNIFMVFLILDNPVNKDSILDITCPTFEDKKATKFIPYMDKFPFPFYIILREISALPQVVGEALRQWFELVTSVDR